MTADNRQTISLLMLSPLVAGTGSSGTALFLGLGSTIVLLAATAILYLLLPAARDQQATTGSRSTVVTPVNFPMLMLVLSVSTSLLMLALQRWFYEATLLTGLWLPLISANLLIVRQLLTVDGTRPFARTMAQSLKLCVFVVSALIGLALCRELLGSGRILMNMHLFTDTITAQGIAVFPDWPRLKLFEMAPGALLLLALILAGQRVWQSRHPMPRVETSTPDSSRRVRVTGKIT